MKKLCNILLMTIFVASYSHQNLHSQTTDQKKPVNYQAWVTSFHEFSTPCYLSSLEDSIIGFYTIAINETMYFRIDEIHTLEFRKKGNVGTGAIFGAITGFLVGGIIGIAQGDDPPGIFSFSASTKGLVLGAVSILPGALIGGIIGTAKVKIPIYGSQKNYNAQRAQLEKYKYKYML